MHAHRHLDLPYSSRSVDPSIFQTTCRLTCFFSLMVGHCFACSACTQFVELGTCTVCSPTLEALAGLPLPRPYPAVRGSPETCRCKSRETLFWAMLKSEPTFSHLCDVVSRSIRCFRNISNVCLLEAMSTNQMSISRYIPKSRAIEKWRSLTWKCNALECCH